MRTKIPWDEVQKYHDEGHTQQEICDHFNICIASINKARKSKKLITRNPKEGQQLSIKRNRRDYSVFRTEEHRKKMKKYGGFQEGSGRCKIYVYKSAKYGEMRLQGTWELALAHYLETNGVEWKKNTQSFDYYFEGCERKYHPDFYLPATDEYIEVKGYKTDKDAAKWEEFPKKLIVADKDYFERNGISLRAKDIRNIPVEPSGSSLPVPSFRCKCCGGERDKGARLCKECSKEKKLKNIPSKEELLAKLLEVGMSGIAKFYNKKSSSSVVKWMVFHGIDYKEISPHSRGNKSKNKRVRVPVVHNSIYKFVRMRAARKTWVASINRVGFKRVFKTFRTEEDAARFVADTLGSSELIVR